MRKSLIITATLMVSSLFAGAALADEASRGAEKPSLRADRSDGARNYAEKMRERNEYQGRAVTTRGATVNHKLDTHRQKGDMVEEKHNSRSHQVNNSKLQTGKSLVAKTVAEKRSDISEKARKRSDAQNNGGKRAFTVANDRRGHGSHDGPKTIVDVMARRELLKFLGAAGVKINCSQTGTCTEETPM